MLNLFSSRSRGHAGRRGTWLSVVTVAGVLALGAPAANAAAAPAGSSQAAAAPTAAAQAATAAQTTKQYVIRFWPRYISFGQQTAAFVGVGANRLTGVVKMGPKFRIVNLINDDTVYSSGFVDLRKGPVVVTIPPTTAVYSILQLDVWGNVLSGIPSEKPGAYALVLKGWRGTLPRGLTKVTMPYPVTSLTVRGDKYSNTGVNTTPEATAFRDGLRIAPLA